VTRLFVAIDLPGFVKQRLASLCAGVPHARWARPEQFHITMRFIGEVDGPTFDDIGTALTEVPFFPFELRLAGVGEYGDRRRTRVLWAGVEASSELELLHDRIEAAVSRVGLPRERRSFKPHVSLARLDRPTDDRVRDFLTYHARFALGPFDIDGFTLFSSVTTGTGPLYRAEAVYPL
jgi:RNA 2',3'-cyclic 3'-phosphodiesterase